MGCHFSSRLTATLNLCPIYFKITWALVVFLDYMHKKFEINWTKIKGSCQSGRKVVTHDSKSDLPLVFYVSDVWFCLNKMSLVCILHKCKMQLAYILNTTGRRLTNKNRKCQLALTGFLGGHLHERNWVASLLASCFLHRSILHFTARTFILM